MMRELPAAAVAAVVAVVGVGLGATGCSNDDVGPCSLRTNFGCSADLQCETVQGRDLPTCLPPVVVRGHVYDLSTHLTVSGARVLVLGDDGAPLTAASSSATDGSYAVRLHAPRDAAFKPQALRLSPWVQAPGYGQFPDRWRPAPVLDAANAQLTAGGTELDLATADTEVGLLPFGGGPGISEVAGLVAIPDPARQVLVVASSQDSFGGPLGIAGLADATGSYRLFGLVPAHYTVSAYASGSSFLPVPIAVSAGEQATINVPADPTAASTVTGRLQVAGGGRPSVALFVAATYNADSGEGDVPLGLSATAAADGSFSIAGVSPGSYVVVPSPDNDGLALIGAPPTIVVVAGHDLVVPGSIAVGPAVPITGPGAGGPEAVTTAPTLSWSHLADEASYHLTVTSGVGLVVWDMPAVPATASPSVAYSGPFEPGAFYRFRVQALDAHGAPVAASEDLRGIFFRPGP